MWRVILVHLSVTTALDDVLEYCARPRPRPGSAGLPGRSRALPARGGLRLRSGPAADARPRAGRRGVPSLGSPGTVRHLASGSRDRAIDDHPLPPRPGRAQGADARARDQPGGPRSARDATPNASPPSRIHRPGRGALRGDRGWRRGCRAQLRPGEVPLSYLQEQDLLRAFFRRFHKEKASDPKGYETLQALLTAQDMVRFQQKWERYVLGLTYPPDVEQ